MATKSTLFVFLGLLFFSSPFGVFSIEITSPLLMWSNTNAFSGQNIQDVELISIESIVDALRSESSSLSKYFTDKISSSELVIVFTEPKLSTEQFSLLAHAHDTKPTGGALSNLKSLVESSRSSLVFPYVVSRSVGSELTSSLSTIVKGSTYTYTVEQFKKQIASGKWEALTNQVTDLVVIEFSSPAVVSMLSDDSVHASYVSDDASIASIAAALKDVTYTAMFTSNGADSQALDVISIHERQGRSEMASFRANYNQENDLLYTTNWPVGVVEALLVMAPFLAILFIGICCTMQIQSDLKFGAEKAILKKQFM